MLCVSSSAMASAKLPCLNSACACSNTASGALVDLGYFWMNCAELRFRAAPHPVLKRGHRGGIVAMFPRAGGGKSCSPPKTSANKIKSHCREKAMRPNLNDVAR